MTDDYYDEEGNISIFKVRGVAVISLKRQIQLPVNCAIAFFISD